MKNVGTLAGYEVSVEVSSPCKNDLGGYCVSWEAKDLLQMIREISKEFDSDSFFSLIASLAYRMGLDVKEKKFSEIVDIVYSKLDDFGFKDVGLLSGYKIFLTEE